VEKFIFSSHIQPKESRMIKTLIVSSVIVLGLAGPVAAQKGKAAGSSNKSEVKFLNDIEVEVAPSSVQERSKLSDIEIKYFAKKAESSAPSSSFLVENASKLQLKYALLLDTEVEQVINTALYNSIDEWMGTRYRLGGNNKDGIDCSALMQIIYTTQFGINLPRTAREQYEATQRISPADLKEGDLVFFNTQGGVSHVGVYLQNNKFFHASSSGVTISDLYDPYWEKRFISAGRYQKTPDAFVFTSSH
jgi:murein DD-endopeptidase / murein LD-carboxypeptidase